MRGRVTCLTSYKMIAPRRRCHENQLRCAHSSIVRNMQTVSSQIDASSYVPIHGSEGRTEEEDSNLYFANLPLQYSERHLEDLLLPWPVLSTRILRSQSGVSRGVGFALLHCRENCLKVIELLNGVLLGTRPLSVKFARACIRTRGTGEVGPGHSGRPRIGQGRSYHCWALVPVVPLAPVYSATMSYQPTMTFRMPQMDQVQQTPSTTGTARATLTTTGTQPWPQQTEYVSSTADKL